ncbi:5600_t:CDS:1, partial [Racocetra persica]
DFSNDQLYSNTDPNNEVISELVDTDVEELKNQDNISELKTELIFTG